MSQPENALPTTLLLTIETLLAQLSATVRQSCEITVSEVVAMSAAAPDLPDLRERAHRAITALQFQDRHTQLLEDITALLCEARMQQQRGAAPDLEALLAVVRMGEVRSLLLSHVGGVPAAIPDAAATEIELF